MMPRLEWFRLSGIIVIIVVCERVSRISSTTQCCALIRRLKFRVKHTGDIGLS